MPGIFYNLAIDYPSVYLSVCPFTYLCGTIHTELVMSHHKDTCNISNINNFKLLRKVRATRTLLWWGTPVPPCGHSYHEMEHWTEASRGPTVSGNQKWAKLNKIIIYFPICPKECRKRKGQKLAMGPGRPWINSANNRYLVTLSRNKSLVFRNVSKSIICSENSSLI